MLQISGTGIGFILFMLGLIIITPLFQFLVKLIGASLMIMGAFLFFRNVIPRLLQKVTR
jgi:hypothetical protein